MSRLFISYSSKDRDLVTALVDDLEALGHELWFDAELTRTGGQKWWSSILAHLRECDLFIFALTPTSLASEPCKREYGYAHALHKRILPIMLESINVSVLPVALQELQFVDYHERSVKQAMALAATLSNLPPAQPLPDPLPPEPEIPLTPLAQVSQRLDVSSLSSSEQVEIVFDLEPLFNDVSNRAGAEMLLRKLYEREDLTHRVAEKIRSLIPDINTVQERPFVPKFQGSLKSGSKPQKKLEDIVAPLKMDNIKPQHGLWLRSYFIVPILISTWLIYVGLNIINLSYPDLNWFVPLVIIVCILNLVGIYGMWLWKKWGVYVLINSLILSTIIFSNAVVIYMINYGNGEWSVANTYIAISFVVLLVALALLWSVLRNKWQYFQGKPLKILGRQL